MENNVELFNAAHHFDRFFFLFKSNDYFQTKFSKELIMVRIVASTLLVLWWSIQRVLFITRETLRSQRLRRAFKVSFPGRLSNVKNLLFVSPSYPIIYPAKIHTFLAPVVEYRMKNRISLLIHYKYQKKHFKF